MTEIPLAVTEILLALTEILLALTAIPLAVTGIGHRQRCSGEPTVFDILGSGYRPCTTDAVFRRGHPAMQSRLRIQGHPIQPMLVTFPYGLFVCAVLFDLADLAGGLPFFGEVAYWTVVAGLVAAALTAVAGMVDLWDVPAVATRRTAIAFNVVNALMATLFLVTCLIRANVAGRGVTGPLLAVELVALAVGGFGVLLGAVLVQRFDDRRAEPTSFDALRRRPRPRPARAGVTS